MFKLNKVAREIFASDIGEAIYTRILQTIEKHHMEDQIFGGTLLGFSGGADSVMLFMFLLEFKRRTNQSFKIVCVHVNHGIRGEESKRDEIFSSDFVKDSPEEFLSVKIDVPKLSKDTGEGLEEAARNARYAVFNDIIKSRNDISCIAVAHNATDNVETVIFNMLRGTGLRGICGIKPTRDNIVRPIIFISKKEITDLLGKFDIPYVTDSTNLSSDYSRNYIRNEILPLFNRISENPEAAVSRMSDNLLEDLKYIDSSADEFISSYCNGKYIEVSHLRELPDSLFARVFSKIVFLKTAIYPEEKHIRSVRILLQNDDFSYSLPGKYNFSCQRGKCTFIDKINVNPLNTKIFPLFPGENKIKGTNVTIYVGNVKDSSLNVYSFSIKANISFDIINRGIQLRVKQDGDAYKYAGITHKLKKVFNDRDIPSFERNYIPIITDNEGIVWVPGLSVRDGAISKAPHDNLQITICYSDVAEGEIEMFTALKRV